jgi:hypothetical protein
MIMYGLTARLSTAPMCSDIALDLMLRARMSPQQIQHPLNAFLGTKNSLPFDKLWKEFRHRSFLPIYCPQGRPPTGRSIS